MMIELMFIVVSTVGLVVSIVSAADAYLDYNVMKSVGKKGTISILARSNLRSEIIKACIYFIWISLGTVSFFRTHFDALISTRFIAWGLLLAALLMVVTTIENFYTRRQILKEFHDKQAE